MCQITNSRIKKIAKWLLLGLLTVGLVACKTDTDATPLPTPLPGSDSYSQPSSGNITANGVLRPVRQVALSFDVEGNVESIDVEVGENVEVGQTLAALDDTRLQHAVAQAELGLSQAQLRLSQAELKLEQLQEPPDETDIRQAEHAVGQAASALKAAQLNLATTLDSTLYHETLEDAQDVYEDKLHHYERRVEMYESGEEPDYWYVNQAQEWLDDAKLNLDRIQRQGSLQLQDARNAVERAQQAQQEAEDALAQLLEETDPLDVRAARKEIEAAQVNVEAAELALEIVQTDLAQAALMAPFDGVVSAVPANVGEWAGPGITVIELLDVSRWRIETKNVGELQIARVRVGQQVQVRVNAFRDETLQGHVVTISPVAVVQQGDTTYTLMIELEPTDLNLRPGMTAQVEIVIE